jgi:hypothetical protein
LKKAYALKVSLSLQHQYFSTTVSCRRRNDEKAQKDEKVTEKVEELVRSDQFPF